MTGQPPQDGAARRPPPLNLRSVEAERSIAERTAPGGAGRSAVAARDLERYYAVVAAELATIHLTEAEGAAICDALNGTLLEPSTLHLLWAEVASRDTALTVKWHVRVDALAQRLRTFTPGQTYALADAVERFWLIADDSDRPPDELLRTVGLLR